MQDELIALAKISEIDAAAFATDTELEELPAKMAELDGDVQKLGELLAAEKQELAEADSLLSEQSEELNNQSQSLAKSKAKGARARNMREADAVERELEVIRRTMRERERSVVLRCRGDHARGNIAGGFPCGWRGISAGSCRRTERRYELSHAGTGTSLPRS